MIRLVAGRSPSGRALAVKVEPVPVSPAASIPNAFGLSRRDLTPILEHAFGRRLTVHTIQDTVAEFYGLQPKTMRLKDGVPGAREPRIARPRQVAMFFARKLTNQSLPDIGKRFGGRDHSTVIHAIKSVEKRLSEDPYLEIEVEVLRERLSTGELPQKPIVSWMQESEPCKVLA